MGGVLDFLFPKRCVGCGKFGGYLCEKCEVGLWEEEQICPTCCRNSRYGLRHKYCRGDMDGLICFWAYEGIARKIISWAKYKHYYDYLRELIVDNGRLAIAEEFYYLNKLLVEKPVVVPVPLHHNRVRERGFNQAEKIARLFAERSALVVEEMLVRIKDTGRQVGKNRGERLKNMEEAFRMKNIIPQPKSVLLVDDVWTTGATMRECAKVLKKAGVKYVWGLVLAR